MFEKESCVAPLLASIFEGDGQLLPKPACKARAEGTDPKTDRKTAEKRMNEVRRSLQFEDERRQTCIRERWLFFRRKQVKPRLKRKLGNLLALAGDGGASSIARL